MGEQTSCGALSSMFNKLRPYVLMVCLQFLSAGAYIIIMGTLSHGMNRYVLIVYRNAIAALVFGPFALLLERKIRPKMTLQVFLQIMALGFLEPILNQGFTYLGMQYTSASFTSAVMNAVPSVTFAIAVILRLERIRIQDIRSQAKVIGTLVTFGGALIMTLYKGPVIDLVWSRQTGHHGGSSDASHKHWVTGTLLIFVGCVSWSAFFILQSVTIKKYPAELSLTSLICLAGTVQSLAIALIVAHQPGAWALGWDSRLLGSVYTGVISSGITYYVQGQVMGLRGPVFATAFNPLCMIIVAVLGSLILAEKLHLGSVIGGIIIALGLYSVVWGKKKDYSSSSQLPSLAIGKDSAMELPMTVTDGAKLATSNNGSDQSNGN